MIEVKPRHMDIDPLVMKVFMKTIDILGGPRKLIELRNLTWLPSLMEASYVVVMRDKLMKTEAEIAEELGLARQTVHRILASDPEEVMERIREGKETNEHLAGGLAKLAYQQVRDEEKARR